MLYLVGWFFWITLYLLPLNLKEETILRHLDVEWRMLKFTLKTQNVTYWLDSSVSEQVHWRAAARKVINLKTVPQNAGNSLTSWVYGLGLAGKQKPLRTNVTPSFRRSLNDRQFKKPCVKFVSFFKFSCNTGALSQWIFVNVHTNWTIM